MRDRGILVAIVVTWIPAEDKYANREAFCISEVEDGRRANRDRSLGFSPLTRRRARDSSITYTENPRRDRRQTNKSQEVSIIIKS